VRDPGGSPRSLRWTIAGVVGVLVAVNVLDNRVVHASLVVGPAGAALPLTRGAFRDTRYHLSLGNALLTAFVLILCVPRISSVAVTSSVALHAVRP
jgi:hypothetical protein